MKRKVWDGLWRGLWIWGSMFAIVILGLPWACMLGNECRLDRTCQQGQICSNGFCQKGQRTEPSTKRERPQQEQRAESPSEQIAEFLPEQGSVEEEHSPESDASTPETKEQEASPSRTWAIAGTSAKAAAVKGLTVDKQGHVYVAALFQDTLSFAGSLWPSQGSSDIVVAKLSPTTGQPLWQFTLGGTGDDNATDILHNSEGHLILTGWVHSPKATHPNGVIEGGGGFVCKLDPNQKGKILWSQTLRTTATQSGVALRYASVRDTALDSDDNIYITGVFGNQVTFGSYSFSTKEVPQKTKCSSSSGVHDVFVAKLNKMGQWLWAKHLDVDQSCSSGVNTSYSYPRLALDSAHNVYVVAGKELGSFGGSALPSGGFLVKYNSRGAQQWVKPIFNSPFTRINQVQIHQQRLVLLGSLWKSGTVAGQATQLQGSHDLLLAQFDLSGQTQWVKTVAGSPSLKTAIFRFDAKGLGFVAAKLEGSATFGNTTVKAHDQQDIVTAVFDPKGEWSNARVFGKNGIGNVSSMEQNPQGSWIVGGSFKGFFTIAGVELKGINATDLFVANIGGL